MNKLYLKNIKQSMRLWKLRSESKVKRTDKIISDFGQALDENREVISYLLRRGI